LTVVPESCWSGVVVQHVECCSHFDPVIDRCLIRSLVHNATGRNDLGLAGAVLGRYRNHVALDAAGGDHGTQRVDVPSAVVDEGPTVLLVGNCHAGLVGLDAGTGCGIGASGDDAAAALVGDGAPSLDSVSDLGVCQLDRAVVLRQHGIVTNRLLELSEGRELLAVGGCVSFDRIKLQERQLGL